MFAASAATQKDRCCRAVSASSTGVGLGEAAEAVVFHGMAASMSGTPNTNPLSDDLEEEDVDIINFRRVRCRFKG